VNIQMPSSRPLIFEQGHVRSVYISASKYAREATRARCIYLGSF